MLPKKNRAIKKDIEKLFKNRGFLSFGNLTLRYFIEKDLKESKISFIVPKKVAKTAVLRNKLRRIGYKSLENKLTLVPSPLVGVFSFNKASFEDIDNEIKQIFSKIN
ncbi:MAG: ribonuclease P protein component [bacterium]|nr:ribonuclease P protein component [bacterium]